MAERTGETGCGGKRSAPQSLSKADLQAPEKPEFQTIEKAVDTKGQLIWRVLLVDDDDEDYLLTKMLLNQAKGRKVILEWSPSYTAGLGKLNSNHFDAVLVDYDLGEKTGIELIREAVTQGYPAPLILYTGRGSYEVDLEAMQAGASLYLTKGEAGPLMLERAIRYAIERKQVETALNESRESYRQLFNSMLDGFALHEIIYDDCGKPVDYRFLEVNHAFEKLTGLRARDLIGKTVREVMPDTEDYWVETYSEVARSGESVRFEGRSNVLGKYFEVVAFRPEKDQFAVIFTDVTERTLAKEELISAQETLEQMVLARTVELKTSNDTLETIFSGINQLVALMDRDFNFIRVNDNYARADQHSPDFFIGKNHFELYPHAENEAIFRKVVETGEPYRAHAKPFEYPDHPEWGITYWDWCLQPVKDESGQVASLVLTLNDVTEHQRSEMKTQELAQNLEGVATLFEQLFQSSPDAQLLVDASGDILRSNRQVEKIFGYSEVELKGKPIETLLPQQSRRVHLEHRYEYSQHPRLQPMGEAHAYRGFRKDGQEIQVEVLLSPVTIENRLNIICVIRSLSEAA